MQSMQSMQWSKMKMSENPPTPLRQSNLSRRVKLCTGFMNRQINLQKNFENR